MMSRPTITLCMIVKNESHVIERCLRSMAPYIDRYDITDTGSDDGTPKKIKSIMDDLGIEGDVYLSEWKGFGDHAGKMGSRTESLNNCDGKADYAWVMDADDSLEGDFSFPEPMDKDGYFLKLIREGEPGTFHRIQLFKMGLGWIYKGILHEIAFCTTKKPSGAYIEGDYYLWSRADGARAVDVSFEEKYARDAKTLEQALKEEPDNSRYQFYLGQSYVAAKEWGKALVAYQTRIHMGGCEEEVFFSLYQAAHCLKEMGASFEQLLFAFTKAYEYRPGRAEPLTVLAALMREHNMPNMAYLYAQQALSVPSPDESMQFVNTAAYTWQPLEIIALIAFEKGDIQIALDACNKIMEDSETPEDVQQRALANLRACEQKMQGVQADSKISSIRLQKKS